MTGTRGAKGRHSERATAGRTVDAELMSDLVGEMAVGGCASAPGMKGGARGLNWNFLPGGKALGWRSAGTG